MAMHRIFLQLFLVTLLGLELAKAGSDCDGTLDCCCLNGGTEILNDDCCDCSCPTSYSGEFCQTFTSKKKIAKFTFNSGNNDYWTLAMSSEGPGHPIRKALERKNDNDPFDNFASFKVGDAKPTMTFMFRGDGKKDLTFLEGEFMSHIPGQKVNVITIGVNGESPYKTFTFTTPGQYQRWYYDFSGKNVIGVKFKFPTCSVKDCFGINDLSGEYDIALSDPLNCKGFDCGLKGVKAFFDNGCCNCTTIA